MAVALQSIDDVLGDATARAGATTALEIVSSRFDGERWSDQFELLGGNAGIALGALQVGDHELALTAVSPYVERAEATSTGVQWEVHFEVPARLGGRAARTSSPHRPRPRGRGGCRES